MKLLPLNILSAALALAVLCGCSGGDDGEKAPSADPSVASFTPEAAPHGSTLTINGEGFSRSASKNIVTINGIQAEVTSATASVLTVTVPKNTGCTGAVTVTVGGKSASAQAVFTYIPTYVRVATYGSFYINDFKCLATDAAGNIYINDGHCICMITPQGGKTILAGRFDTQGFADGDGQTARFDTPEGIALDNAGNIYVADYGNSRVRRIDAAGNVTTVAGDGTAETLNGPASIALDGEGRVYVAAFYANRIYRITPSGLEVFAGDGTQENLGRPKGIAFDASGNMYATNESNNHIYKISPSGQISTLAGVGPAGNDDGPGDQATFTGPRRLAVDKFDNIYVSQGWSEESCLIRKITPYGEVSTIAGGGNQADGDAMSARLWNPEGIAVDATGNILFANRHSQSISMVVAE